MTSRRALGCTESHLHKERGEVEDDPGVRLALPLAARDGIVAMYTNREFVEEGGSLEWMVVFFSASWEKFSGREGAL
jgi:hypothetical protein